MDSEIAQRVLREFEDRQVRYVIFGAAALNLHGLARFTEDLDLFLAPEPNNLEAMKAALRAVFDDPAIDEISAQELMGDYPAVQYNSPAGDFQIDILTRLGEAFRFEDLQAERVAWGGLEVSVATPRTLYRMKRDTVRLKDRADAQLLRERFRLEED